MTKPKRSADDYIQFKKKITERDVRNIICIIARDRTITAQEVCYDFIKQQAFLEIEKRKIKQ